MEAFIDGSMLLAQTAAEPGICRAVEDAASRCVRALRSGRKIIAFGNGGSASDAQHFACELVGRFERERRALPVVVLNTNVSTLTAVSNDYGFERVFERQIDAFGQKGDVVLALSTSGKSENVNRALKLAGRKGLYRIGLTGKTGGAMARLVDLEIRVPDAPTPRTQEVHITIIHILCDLIEGAFARK